MSCNKCKWFFLGMFAVLISACDGDAEDGAGSDDGEDTPVGVVDEASMWVRVHSDMPEGVVLHQADAAWTTKCEIDSNAALGSAGRDLSCVMEVPEEDLYFHGAKFQYNFPTGMCYYTHVLPYYFENFEIGFVSRSVGSIFVGVAGDIGTAGGAAGSIATPYADGTNGFDSGCDNGGDWDWDYEAKAPFCCYDHSKRSSFAPDCCSGRLIYQPRFWNDDENAFSSGDSVTLKWEQQTLSQCLSGAAMDAAWIKGPGGYPLIEIRQVLDKGLNAEFVPSPLISRGGTLEHASLYFANYFKPSQHSGLPDSTPVPLNRDFGNPHYEFICMDRAREVLARIRMSVREWNEFGEFSLGTSGDPDTVGAETDFPEYTLDDFSDWYSKTLSGHETGTRPSPGALGAGPFPELYSGE